MFKTKQTTMASQFSKVFEYIKIIGQLKEVKRTGWVRNGVKNPESVAEHMYRMAMMAFAIPAESTLNRDRCLKIALVHDMAESIVGDITPWCGIDKAEKQRKEQDSTSYICGLVSKESGDEMYELWQEYENQSSPEAKFVKDLDKFEMLVQAFEYEKKSGQSRSLQEFYTHTKEKYQFSTDIVQAWCQELIKQRDKEECS